jgi:acetyl-CoA carboxylase biotin carboxyl carrier protein
MKQQDIDDLRELIEFLKQHGVAEFDVDRGDLKIRLKFNPPESASAGLSDLAQLLKAAQQGVAQAPVAAAQAGAAPGSAGAAAEPAADPEAGLHRSTDRRRRARRRLFRLEIVWSRAR